MSKIRGKDFAETVVITPEENEAIKQKAEADLQAADKQVTKEKIMGGDIKGPPRGLSRWSIFFLAVIILLLGFGILAYSST